jgi:hypothetical protein
VVSFVGCEWLLRSCLEANKFEYGTQLGFEYSLCVGKKFVFSGFLAGLRLVVIFMRLSKYIENAKFCAESNGGGDFYRRPLHPF